MACDCIESFNDLLATKNGKLEIGIAFNMETGSTRAYPVIGVEKIDKKGRKRPPGVIPTFCPFCGVRYTPSESAR